MMRWLSIVLLLAMCPAAAALEDTPRNREQQADRYLKVVPPEELMTDMVDKMSGLNPFDKDGAFTRAMMKEFDIEALTAAMRAALIKTLTADEIAALADFQSSPVGKSVRRKMGDFMAELMPVLMWEMARSQSAVMEEMKQQRK